MVRNTSIFTSGQRVWWQGKLFDFGYVGQTGMAVLYEPGNRNMQDSFAVGMSEVKASDPDTSQDNPEMPQDRAEDMLDNWRKYHYVMFPQQRAIYRQLAERLTSMTVLEAGCGSGQGSHMLHRKAQWLIATDVSESNIAFAREIYPTIKFEVWDVVSGPYPKAVKADLVEAVVAVEMIEHVRNVHAAIANLIGSARREVWISTPNGRGKPRPPENPFHVREYTPYEMLDLLMPFSPKKIEVLGWENFKPQHLDTDVSPLVYRVIKEQPS